MGVPTFNPDDLAAWSDGAWRGRGPERIEGVSHDTRTVRKGNIFFAIRGARHDGHDFVGEAFRKGAGSAVVDQKWADARAAGPGGSLLVVEDTSRALIAVAAGHRKKAKAAIIGVTGSVGKSTVKGMTAAVLAAAGPTWSSRGSWNNAIGLPLSILGMDEGCRFGVFELGTNHPGEISFLSGVLRPECGVVTAIGPAHIEYFGTLERIADEKGDLLRALPADGAAVLDMDGPFYSSLRRLCRGRVLTVSMGREGDLSLAGWNASSGEAAVVEGGSGKSHALRVRCVGRHNAFNAMLAAAVGRLYGVDWSDIGAGIAGYSPLPMRCEALDVKGVRLINDACNANPLSMRAAIEALDEEAGGGGKWLVLGGMLELGSREEEEHRSLGAEMALKRGAGGEKEGGKQAVRLVVVGKLGGLMADGAVAAGWADGSLWRCRDAEEAAEVLLKNVVPGDTILVKASRRVALESVIEKLKKTWGEGNDESH